MQVGSYQIDFVTDGTFALDGGAMFGIIPRPLWSRDNPPDARNRIDMGLRCMVCRGEDHVILVDAGIGGKFDAKFFDIYRIDHSATDIQRSLATLGISPEQVTDVIITHLHFDHAGGLTVTDGDRPRPRFPRARHLVQRRHLEWATSPSPKDSGSFLPENFRPLQEAGLLELLDGPEEVFAGLELHLLEGHTPAMQAVLVDGDPPLFYAADLFPMTAHLHLPYIMAYDVAPLITVKEKELYLRRAVERNWRVAFEHDPVVKVGTVARFKDRYGLGSVLLGECTTAAAGDSVESI